MATTEARKDFCWSRAVFPGEVVVFVSFAAVHKGRANREVGPKARVENILATLRKLIVGDDQRVRDPAYGFEPTWMVDRFLRFVELNTDNAVNVKLSAIRRNF